jgi:LmbE family N-acetylglucosaminyl deacetylase
MPLRLLAVFAHPDDESFGVGGTLAKYASEGVEVFLLTATHGDSGKYRGLTAGEPGHPGAAALAAIRRRELEAAASVLGLTGVTLLDYRDRYLDTVEPSEIIGCIAEHIGTIHPDVVLTFGPDGIYGHPDHIAISQFTTGAIVAAADAGVSKLYYAVWPQSMWAAHEAAFKKWFSTVDGVARYATPWPDWAITTMIDARPHWPAVLRAVACHESQFAAYAHLAELPPEDHEALWGWQGYYRVFSLVNGGRARETDLFDGLRGRGSQA